MALVLLVLLYLLLAVTLAALAAWLEAGAAGAGAVGAAEAAGSSSPAAGGAIRRRRAGRRLRAGWPAVVVLTLLPLAFTGSGFLPGTTLAPTPLLAGVSPWAEPERVATVRAEADANPLLLDPLSQFLPWREAARRDLLFNPSQGGGAALLANGQSAVLFPTEVVARGLSPFRAATYSQAARLLIAAWGMFLLAAAVLRSAALVPPLAAAVAWMGCGFLQVWRLHPHTLVAAMAPWVIYALLRLARRPGPGPAVGLAVAGALSVAAGHPETLLHVLLFALLAGAAVWASPAPPTAPRPPAPSRPRTASIASAASRSPAGPREAAAPLPVQRPSSSASGPTSGGRRRRPLTVAAWGTVSALLAALLAAPLLLPFVENLRVSSEWVLRRDVGTVVEVPWAEAVERLRPTFVLHALGDPVAGTWEGPENLAELAGGSVGAAALVLALLALAGRRRGLAAALLLLGLLGLLVSVHLPVLSRPFGEVPLLRESLLKRLSLWWSLAVALLVAMGVEAWWERWQRRGTGGWRPAAPLLPAVLLVAAVVAWAARGGEGGAAAAVRGLDWESGLGWEWGSLAVVVAVLLAVGSFLARGSAGARVGGGSSAAGSEGRGESGAGDAAGAGGHARPEGFPVLASLLLVTLLVPRAALFAGWIPVVGPESFYPDTLATRHVQAALSGVAAAGYRVVGLDAALVPHSAAFFGFPEVRAYDPMTFAPYAEFLAHAEAPPRRTTAGEVAGDEASGETTGPTAEGSATAPAAVASSSAPSVPLLEPVLDPASESSPGRRHGWHRLVDPSSPILAFLGARWIFDHPSMGRRPGLTPVYLDAGALVHENPAALPRAFVPDRAVVYATPEEAVAAAGAIADFARVVTLTGLDVGYLPPGGPGRRLPSGPAEVGELVVEPRRLAAVVTAEAPALLATSQPAIPGWRVLLDGEVAERVLVNGAFLGVVVEEGRHRVEMVYAPASWRWGLALGALGLTLAVALVAVPRLAGARSHAPAERMG